MAYIVSDINNLLKSFSYFDSVDQTVLEMEVKVQVKNKQKPLLGITNRFSTQKSLFAFISHSDICIVLYPRILHSHYVTLYKYSF